MAAHPRFFPGQGPQPLAALLAAAEAKAEGEVDGDVGRRFSGVAALAEAGPDEIAYLETAKHREALSATRAGAVVLREGEAAVQAFSCQHGQ